MKAGPFCIQGMEVYETGDARLKGIPKNSLVIFAHVCDDCRHKGGEIHIDMIDANGHGRAIVYSATNAAAPKKRGIITLLLNSYNRAVWHRKR